MNGSILPGETLGVLGSGQLGRMFAIAARRMGYRVHVFSPDKDTPAGQVADVEIQSPYNDLEAVGRFARSVSVVTFEFENVPADAAESAARYVAVRPQGEVLQITQYRVREKAFLQRHGFPLTQFSVVQSLQDLRQSLEWIGCPAVLKTAGWGYDGKGQILIQDPHEADAAWQTLKASEAVLETFVDFDYELSVIVARGLDGAMVTYGPIENEHSNHILDVSCAPSGVPERIKAEALDIACALAMKLNVVGVLCVEFFMTCDGRLLVNELAPRPHNSGHLTIDAHVTCQFEQQVRAVCGLPLGSTRQNRPAAMANLLGDHLTSANARIETVLSWPAIKLHLYGKRELRSDRKMGHLTVLADNAATAKSYVKNARQFLSHGMDERRQCGSDCDERPHWI